MMKSDDRNKENSGYYLGIWTNICFSLVIWIRDHKIEEYNWNAITRIKSMEKKIWYVGEESNNYN